MCEFKIITLTQTGECQEKVVALTLHRGWVTPLTRKQGHTPWADASHHFRLRAQQPVALQAPPLNTNCS